MSPSPEYVGRGDLKYHTQWAKAEFWQRVNRLVGKTEQSTRSGMCPTYLEGFIIEEESGCVHPLVSVSYEGDSYFFALGGEKFSKAFPAYRYCDNDQGYLEVDWGGSQNTTCYPLSPETELTTPFKAKSRAFMFEQRSPDDCIRLSCYEKLLKGLKRAGGLR